MARKQTLADFYGARAPRIEALRDAELTAAMDEHGLILAEEAVAGQLLDDLCQEVGD